MEPKERVRRRKGGEEKKAVALLVFVIATLEIIFGRKKLLDAKGLFGENVIKNPARYIYIYISNLRKLGDKNCLTYFTARPYSFFYI